METTQSILTIHVLFTKLVKRIFLVLFYMLFKFMHDILFKHGIVVLYYSVKLHKGFYVVRAFKLFSFLCCVVFLCFVSLTPRYNWNTANVGVKHLPINQSIIYLSSSCVLYYQCIWPWTIRTWLPLRFPLTFIYGQQYNQCLK